MATETTTTYAYRCDLCGALTSEAELARLEHCDICVQCTARPISELLAWLAAARR
jgi:hypothetical protein